MTDETKEFLKDKTRKYGTIGSFSIVSLLLLFQTFNDMFSSEDIEKILKDNCDKIEKLEKENIQITTKLELYFKGIEEKLSMMEKNLKENIDDLKRTK